MSLTTTSARYQYAGNSIATAFSFPEPFLANADLKVVFTVANVDTVQTTGFTITGALLADGGSVTFSIAPPTGTTVTIYRDPTQTQPVRYTTEDDFPAASHERSLDRLTMYVQALALKLKRAVRLPVTNAEVDELTLTARAGKLPAFNATTGALELIAASSEVAAAASAEASAASAAQASESAVLAASATTESLVNTIVFNYAAAVTSAGGTISRSTLNELRVNLHPVLASGVWDKILELWLPAGDSITSALVKLKTSGAASLTNSNFVAGDYTEGSSLWAGSTNTNKKLTSDFNPVSSGLSATNMSVGYYSLSDSWTGVALGGSNSAFYLGYGNGGGSNQIGSTSVNNVSGYRLKTLTLNSSNVLGVTQNAIETTLGVNASSPNGVLTPYVYGSGFYSNIRLGGYYAASALTTAELRVVATFFDSVSRALGRSINAPTAVFFGDSITQGSGATTTADRWSTLTALKLGLTEVNSGISGTTLLNVSPTGANNARDSYLMRALVKMPTKLFILYGTNDISKDSANFTTVNFEIQYGEIIEALLSAGILAEQITLGTPPYATAVTDSAAARATRQASFSASVKAVGAKYGITVRDVNAVTAASAALGVLSSDNLHPNDFGHLTVSSAMLGIGAINLAGDYYQSQAEQVVSAYSTAVVSAGGTIRTQSLNVIKRELVPLIRSGVYAKLKELWVPSGDTLTSALVKLKTPGAASLTNSNFVSADYTEIGSLWAGATNANKKLSSDFNPSSNGLTATNMSVGFYSLSDTWTGVALGTNNNVFYVGYTGGGHQIGSSNPTTVLGYRLKTLTAGVSNVTSATQNAIEKTVVVNATSPNGTIDLYSTNSSFFSNVRLGGYYVSSALTTTELQVLSNFFDQVSIQLNRSINSKNLVLFGDSIVAGSGASVAAKQFSTMLAADLGLTEYNQGSGGSPLQTTVTSPIAGSGRARYVTSVLVKFPEKAVILYGLNDARFDTDSANEYTTARFETQYCEIIEGLLSAGFSPSQLILGTISYSNGTTTSGAAIATRAASFTASVLTVAEKYGIKVANVNAISNAAVAAGYPYINTDLLHPNDSGHETIRRAFRGESIVGAPWYLSNTATLNFPSIAATGGTQDLTVTVTGATVGDSVQIGLPAAPSAGVTFNAWVSATDTVTIRATNATAGAIDPASATYRVTVRKA
ncbi:SGNH_hydrolase domain containing protein [uncultured Caudovirales phage]|uniref:SGNH_hydrolase domain containing protein n=1 Tax=uncultured Caudovirales phage TaxID=2100421 RepID=A0A6J5QGC8_9CAUD|nr:SGNH_hydrolase domain containing protein [uncultured Caudovirales phage]